MKNLATRQVHLDFHTSEKIEGIGENFSKENFQEALKMGMINSITVFAKCHHGWCYYPTKVGKMHPELSFDLLKEMIDAAHEIGVRAPIYITLGWSANDANLHEDWLVRDKQGNIATNHEYDLNAKPEDVIPKFAWKKLCPSGEYAQHIIDLTQEICDGYDVDGLFYDICFYGETCYCHNCIEGMKRQGLDIDNLGDAKNYFNSLRQDLGAKCFEILKKKNKDGTIFFNGGANKYYPVRYNLHTHIEMEDLPTAWGGYDKMPLNAKFFARIDKDYLGMTGKFHTAWGEFGGYKNPNALRYEVASLSAFGAKCSVGDQLHPSGEMDLETYRIIGEAYRCVQEMEPYCYNGKETAKLGVLLSKSDGADEGVVKMLLETQNDFSIIMQEDDLSLYDAIILPDCVSLTKSQADKINAFIKNGGGILLTGTSGVELGKGEFLIDIGAKYIGKSQYDVDYVRADCLNDGIVTSAFLMYNSANMIEVTDAEKLSAIKVPYFNRRYSHYCSHQQAPYTKEDAEYPSAIQKGNVIYLAHDIFTQYLKHGAKIHRDFVMNALKMIYKNPVMKVLLPSSGRARFMKQGERYILHLLYATPIQRGDTCVIEDMPPIYDVKVAVKPDKKITKVYLAPSEQKIPFSYEKDYVAFSVPKVECNQMVVLE